MYYDTVRCPLCGCEEKIAVNWNSFLYLIFNKFPTNIIGEFMNILDDKTSIMKDPEMGIKFIIYEKAEIKKMDMKLN